MLTSYRDGQLDDIKERMHQYLALVRNWFLGAVVVLIALLVYWALHPQNLIAVGAILACLVLLIALGVQYVRENNHYRKEAPEILSQDLDLEKFEAVLDYETLTTTKFQTNWDRVIIRQAELAFLRGDFEETDKFLEMINPLKIKVSPKERTPLLLTYYGLDFANAIFSDKEYDLDACLSNMDDLVVQNDLELAQKIYAKQIVSLIAGVLGEEKAQENPDEIVASNTLEELLRDYLLAENARLAGDKDLAKKLFKKVSQVNGALFIVKESKAALKKMK